MRTHKQSGKTRYIALAALLLAIATAVLLASCAQNSAQGYLRLHIRADSDSEIDQNVKLAVRDAVVAYLTPIAQQATDKEAMQEALSTRLSAIEQVANEVLRDAKMAYTSHAYLSHESFPKRTYGDLTLAKGDYDALVIELGSGQGANWWCVAFPPLCFVAYEESGDDSIQYRSAIAEWFRNHCKEN